MRVVNRNKKTNTKPLVRKIIGAGVLLSVPFFLGCGASTMGATVKEMDLKKPKVEKVEPVKVKKPPKVSRTTSIENLSFSGNWIRFEGTLSEYDNGRYLNTHVRIEQELNFSMDGFLKSYYGPEMKEKMLAVSVVNKTQKLVVVTNAGVYIYGIQVGKNGYELVEKEFFDYIENEPQYYGAKDPVLGAAIAINPDDWKGLTVITITKGGFIHPFRLWPKKDPRYTRLSSPDYGYKFGKISKRELTEEVVLEELEKNPNSLLWPFADDIKDIFIYPKNENTFFVLLVGKKGRNIRWSYEFTVSGENNPIELAYKMATYSDVGIKNITGIFGYGGKELVSGVEAAQDLINFSQLPDIVVDAEGFDGKKIKKSIRVK